MSLAFWSTVSLCLTTILTDLLIFRFYAEVYQIKIKTKYMVAILFVIATAIHLLINRTVLYFNLPPVLNSVYGVIQINIWSIVLCEEKLKRKIPFNIVYFLILMISDVLSVTICSVIENISVKNVLSSDKYVIFGCALNLLLMFLLCNIFIYVVSRKALTKMKTTQIILLLLLTVFEVFVVFTYTFKISNYLDGIIAIIMVVGFLAFDFAITYVIEMMSHFYEDKMELNLIRKQNELQLANYIEIDKKYRESERIIHDIKKHLYTLSKLSNIDNEKAENYRKLIEEGIDSLVMGFHCTNQILSIVMSQKISAAENENICVETDVQDLTLEFISDIDITAIFANLWDNAIEACLKVDAEKRKISFMMKQSGGFVIISIKNSYDNNLSIENGRFLSTKKNHKGIGMSIIKTAVEKYNGVLVADSDEDIFNVEITVPIPVK